VGHEVFFTGLFGQHAGRLRNLPIARFGNISRLPGEPIAIRRLGNSTEEIEGYLVEATSWGGHSGSPAFWLYPVSMVWFAPSSDRPDSQIPVSSPGQIIGLMGLVSAHFDIPREATTKGDILGRIVTSINSGIAVVTPAHFIRQLIDSEPVRDEIS
jgi:hypothetical protein